MNLSHPIPSISFLSHPTPVPAWRVSGGERDSFHRFFDSSPVSPSGRYLVYHEIDRRNISTLSRSSQAVDIVVADLFTGDHSVVESSLAWAAQLGAQAQWSRAHTHTKATTQEGNEGERVDFLYYNRLSTSGCSVQNTHAHRCSDNGEERVHVRGVGLSFPKGERREYPCAIYHVSADGRYSASVDLLSIGRTQKGYGVDWVAEETTPLVGGQEDGVFVNNLHTGQCVMLYSMREIAASIGIDLNKKRLFGFHTKWSTDGKRILFVMRSIEDGIRSQSKRQHRRHTSRRNGRERSNDKGGDVSLAKRISNHFVDVFLPAPRVRVQHLFVLFTEFIDDVSFTLKERRVKYILSWASKPFRYQFPINGSSPTDCDKRSCTVVLRDGNHPNWIPRSHSISMNFEADSFGQNQQECGIQVEKQQQQLDEQKQPKALQSIFQVVRIDTDSVPESLPLFHRSFGFMTPKICENHLIKNDRSMEEKESLSNAVKVDVVWPFGSGHPSIHSSGRWMIIDEYAKEAASKTNNEQLISSELFDQNNNVVNASLWLVDLIKRKVVVEIKVPIAEYSPSEGLVANLQKFIVGEKDDRSWRCDLHPTWDSNAQQIIVNYWNATSHSRQVALINLQSFLGA